MSNAAFFVAELQKKTFSKSALAKCSKYKTIISTL